MQYFGWGSSSWTLPMLQGLLVTLELAAASYLLGVVLSIVGAAASLSRHAWLRHIATAYTVLGRAVPELLVIFLIYYGGAVVLQWFLAMVGIAGAIEVSSFAAGVASLGFIVGAGGTAILRGSFLALNRGQRDAAMALGLKPLQSFFLVLLPQAWRLAVPGFGNLWMGLLKETALVSVIGLKDLLRVARMASGATLEPMPFLLATGVCYLALTAVSLAVIRRYVARLQRHAV